MATDSDKLYWNYLAHALAWDEKDPCRCGDPGCFGLHDDQLVRELLASPRPGRESMMGDREREQLAAAPERFRVYRGTIEGAEASDALSFSWTLDRGTAIWHARRAADNLDVEAHPVVLEGVVARDDVIALFTERSEHEVLVLPEHVRITNERRTRGRGEQSKKLRFEAG